jgi:hypothetical protein
VLQAGRQPPIPPGSVIEAGLAVAQIRAAPTPTKRRAPSECSADRVPAVNELSQEQHVGAALHFARVGVNLFAFPNQRQARGPASRVDLDPHWLHDGRFHRPINQTDREWHEPMYPRAFALKQQPGPFFGTRHQRPLPLVQDKHCQV